MMFRRLIRKFFKSKENRIVSENELLETAKKALESKSIENDEHELIESVLAFGDTLVREVMTPRPDIVSVPDSFTVSAAMEVAVLNGFSRVPVSSENLDEIVGVVFAKDMMEAQLDGDGEISVKILARSPQFIPETKKAGLLLREMQSNHYHLAIVVDEYAGIAGILTIEDVLEQIVGEIEDEFDYDENEDNIIQEETTTFRIKASTELEEFNEFFNTNYPINENQTVGGLVISKLGHLPKKNEPIHFDGFDIEVLRRDSRRLYLLRFSVNLDQVDQDILN